MTRFLLAAALVAALPLAARPRPVRPRKARPQPVQPAGIVNAGALAPFLEALGQPRPAVRILQFGDSHTSADYLSGQVRKRLQDRFGDGGPGCVLPGRPWRGYPHAGVRFLAGQAWPATSLRVKDGDGWVGLPGAAVTPVPGEAFRVRAAFDTFRVTLLGPGTGAVTAAWAPQDAPAGPEVPVPCLSEEALAEGKVLRTFALDLPPDVPPDALPGAPPYAPRTGPLELALTLPPDTRMLGLDLLARRPGVVYDELGLNGAELPDLGRWNPALRRALLGAAKPALVVLAYGTNDMGCSPADQPDYETRVRALLRAVREESGAPVLLVGPLDRPGRTRRQRAALKAGAAWIIPFLTRASQEAGCAFWDARRAMGGPGSMLQWRRKHLAQKDLVHLNGAGYQHLGDLLADALLEAFRRR